MHLTFDCINGGETPISLPAALVPASKAHLLPQQQQAAPQQITYQQAQPTGYNQQIVPTQATGYYQQQSFNGYQQAEPEFSWDMTSDDMTSYQNIYAKYANDSGKVKCSVFSGG
jgi:hypothetical protein